MAALAWKAFSLNRGTKAMYRKLGNRFGSRRRQTHHNTAYLLRAHWLLTKLRSYGLTGAGNVHALELGSGWMHFYALYLRLFEDMRITLYDVWDNRQLGALKSAFGEVATNATVFANHTPQEIARAKAVIATVAKAQTFEEIYEHLGFNYIVDPEGGLSSLENGVYDFIFSMDVLEHVRKESLEKSIESYYRVLRPGGLSIHQIGVDDHLTHYDQSSSKKQYLAYSESRWRHMFQNDVQYFNRCSFDEFRTIFLRIGFEEAEASTDRQPEELAGIKIAPQFRNQSQESLEATRVYLIHRKPK
jgi:SAM-dependent methyltransferase